MLPIAIDFVDSWSSPFVGWTPFKYGVKQVALALEVALVSFIMTSLDFVGRFGGAVRISIASSLEASMNLMVYVDDLVL